MIKGIAHVCFMVKDLSASQEFYCDRLGLKHAFDFINDAGERFGMYIHAGERSFIELFAGTPDGPDDKQSYRHLCLEVDDIEATVSDLRSGGVELTEPTFGADGSWQSWTADPDGNPIELHGYTPKSMQAAHLR